MDENNQQLSQPVETMPKISKATNKKWFLIALIILFIVLVSGAAFYFGAYYGQFKPLTQYNSKQVSNQNPTPTVAQTSKNYISGNGMAYISCQDIKWQSNSNLPITSTASGYLLYRHMYNFEAYYQFEIPSTWASYTDNSFSDTVRTNFGPSHYWYQQENTVLDIPITAYVTFACDKKLTTIDPKSWSDSNYGKYFSSKDTDMKYTTINLDGISARKYEIQSQAGIDTNIYFTKGDLVFVIVVKGGDKNIVDHIISSFKLLTRP